MLLDEGKGRKCPKFILFGGCRGKDDFSRVEELKREAEKLGLKSDDEIEFRVNEPFEQIQSVLRTALIGKRVMYNSFFWFNIYVC